jgi:hypothetical protein
MRSEALPHLSTCIRVGSWDKQACGVWGGTAERHRGTSMSLQALPHLTNRSRVWQLCIWWCVQMGAPLHSAVGVLRGVGKGEGTAEGKGEGRTGERTGEGRGEGTKGEGREGEGKGRRNRGTLSVTQPLTMHACTVGSPARLCQETRHVGCDSLVLFRPGLSSQPGTG